VLEFMLGFMKFSVFRLTIQIRGKSGVVRKRGENWDGGVTGVNERGSINCY